MRLIVNPAAGRGAGRRALARLRELAGGKRIQLTVSESPAELVSQARRAAEEDEDRLLVAGGDGTFHLAIQGLAGSECALGMIPLGTGNDLPAIVGAPRDLAAAFEVACEGSTCKIDLGSVRCFQVGNDTSPGVLPGPPVASGAVPFAIYCGVGFDGEVTLRARRIRRLRGPLTYALATLATLTRFVPPRLTIEHDGGVFTGEAMFAIAANGERFGGGMRIAPGARVDDGLLDLVIVERVSKTAFLRIFPSVYRGGHLSHPAVRHLRSRRVRLTAERPTPLTADGEPLGEVGNRTALDLALAPASLRVVGAPL
ncbi:MAG: diacylglycerol/lipid kinase family protein [Thermoanaerobaculia bacterium]